jgi:SAM-dependent methyltransferase
MARIAEWRGDPNATTRSEAMQVFILAKLSKNEVFYDLGCGHGKVVIWAAEFCKKSIGIEDIKEYVAQAKQNVQKCRLTNVKIICEDFSQHPLPHADVLYCIIHLSRNKFRKWDRSTHKRTLRIVTLGPPPVSIMPVATKDSFCLTRFPFELATSRKDWYHAVLGRRNGSWEEVRKKFKKLDPKELRCLRKDVMNYFPIRSRSKHLRR